MAVYRVLKFEDFFQPQKDEEYTAIAFFDNMIKGDFLGHLLRMSNGQGAMINNSMGYCLPEEYDEEEDEEELKDHIEVWEDCGGYINRCYLSCTQFIELLEIAGMVWLNNNMIKNNFRAINEFDKETIELFVNTMRKRYLG